MREVQNKWNTLKMNDDIWAKLIYFEQNRRLAKAYVSAPILTIDGSTNGLDGFRIGLSGIDNLHRGLDSIGCLRSIGQGIKLKIDSQGNILMRKIGKSSPDRCSVWVKEWPSSSKLANPQAKPAGTKSGAIGSEAKVVSAKMSSSDLSSSSSSSASLSFNCDSFTSSSGASSSATGDGGDQNWIMQEIEECDVSYKIFDMNHFRKQLELRRSDDTLAMDWRQCVSIISFARGNISSNNHQYTNFNHHHRNPSRGDRLNPARSTTTTTTTIDSPQRILKDPCWLMLINIIAIDVLKSSICDRRRLSSSSLLAGTGNGSMSSTAARSSLMKSKASPFSMMDTNNQHQFQVGDASLADYLSPFELNNLRSVAGKNVSLAPAMSSTRNTTSRAILRRPASSQWDTTGANHGNRTTTTTTTSYGGALRTSSSSASIYAPQSRLGRNSLQLPADTGSATSGGRASTTSRAGSQYNAKNRTHYQSSQYLGAPGGSSSNYGTANYYGTSNSNNNVIYTTFTGLNRNQCNTNQFRQKQSDLGCSSNDHYATGGHAMSYGHKPRDSMAQSSASSSIYHHGQLYNNSVGHNQTRSSSRWNLDQHFNGKIPYVRNFDELRMKSQSLSNFSDWSHHNNSLVSNNKRLLIEPRSFRSSSIKMNFDDDEEEDEDEAEYDNNGHDLEQLGRAYETSKPAAQPDSDNEGVDDGYHDIKQMSHKLDPSSVLEHSTSRQTARPSSRNQANNATGGLGSRRAIIELNKRTTNRSQQLDNVRSVRTGGSQQQLKQHFDGVRLDENDDEAADDDHDNGPTDANNMNDSINHGDRPKDVFVSNGSPEEYTDKEAKQDDHNLKGGDEKAKNSHATNEDNLQKQEQEQIQKLSRASVASTSSSSGCPENDYFISNSSPSMSSSGVSHEGELFGHQPPSSSGIVCSGNTSDDYEIYGRTVTANNKILGASSDEIIHFNNTNSQTVDADSRNSKRSDTIRKMKLDNEDDDIADRKDRHLSRSISRNRHHNVKTMDLPEDEMICDHYEPCDCIQNDEQAASCDCCCDCDLYGPSIVSDPMQPIDGCESCLAMGEVLVAKKPAKAGGDLHLQFLADAKKVDDDKSKKSKTKMTDSAQILTKSSTKRSLIGSLLKRAQRDVKG